MYLLCTGSTSDVINLLENTCYFIGLWLKLDVCVHLKLMHIEYKYCVIIAARYYWNWFHLHSAWVRVRWVECSCWQWSLANIFCGTAVNAIFTESVFSCTLIGNERKKSTPHRTLHFLEHFGCNSIVYSKSMQKIGDQSKMCFKLFFTENLLIIVLSTSFPLQHWSNP